MTIEQTPMEKFISENWMPDSFEHPLICAYRAEKEYVIQHVNEYLKRIAELEAQVDRITIQEKMLWEEIDKFLMNGGDDTSTFRYNLDAINEKIELKPYEE